MQRTLRILRASLIVLSLILFLTSCVFWIRSRRVTDTLNLTPFPSKWSLFTQSGTLHLNRNRPWLEREELPRGIILRQSERSFFGFGVIENEESRSWQVPSPGIIIYGTTIKTYFIPLWFCSALFSILPLIQLPRIVRHIHRRILSLCPQCGYDLRASPDKCPECGRCSTRPRVTISA